MYQNGKTQTQLAREYGVSISALSRWIKLFSEVKIDDQTVMTAKQIKELQKRNALLEEENFLTKWIFLGDESRRIFVSWILKIDVAEIEEDKTLILKSLN